MSERLKEQENRHAKELEDIQERMGEVVIERSENKEKASKFEKEFEKVKRIKCELENDIAIVREELEQFKRLNDSKNEEIKDLKSQLSGC